MKEQGFVYILTNPSFREDWVKIGMSSRPVEYRVKELDTTALPLPFEVFAIMKTTKYIQAEKLIHHYIERFTNLRIRDNREFFNIRPEVALDIFREVATVLDDAEIEETYKSVLGLIPRNRKVDSRPISVSPIRSGQKTWLIPSNVKFFDIEGCLNEFGEVYWSQHFNFQTGDIIYIYSASPDSRVKYKVEVIGHDLPFDLSMERERKYSIDPADFDKLVSHNRFSLFKLIGISHSDRVTLVHLMEHGLKGAPQGANTLSGELLTYIEENF